MPVTYSPEKKLENYSDFMYEFLLKKSFDEAQPMGNIGASDFRKIINAGLVGLSEKYAPFIDRSIEWMQYGIDSKEGGAVFCLNMLNSQKLLPWQNGTKRVLMI